MLGRFTLPLSLPDAGKANDTPRHSDLLYLLIIFTISYSVFLLLAFCLAIIVLQQLLHTSLKNFPFQSNRHDNSISPSKLSFLLSIPLPTPYQDEQENASVVAQSLP